jgi:hypothetical protein
VDARTGEPIGDVQLSGGRPGRTNVIEDNRTTGPDGTFHLVYPDEFSENPDKYDYYTFRAECPMKVPKDNWATLDSEVGDPLYLEYEEHRPKPAAIGDVRLVPQFAFIKGTVVDADTGAPLRGVTVRLRRPGKWLQEAVTDANGEYRLRVNAYTGRRWPCVETTPEQYRPKSRRYKERQQEYALAANWKQTGPGAEYKEVATAHPDHASDDQIAVAIPIVSSVGPELYTRVDFRVPKESSATEVSPELVQVTPPDGGTVRGSDLESILARLDALINQHQNALNKVTDYRSLQCNEELLRQMKEVRKALEAL